MAFIKGWLGYLDSNQGMPVPKTGALPLGYTPKEKTLTVIFAPYSDSHDYTQYLKIKAFTFLS